MKHKNYQNKTTGGEGKRERRERERERKRDNRRGEGGGERKRVEKTIAISSWDSFDTKHNFKTIQSEVIFGLF